jgi:multidrug efflux pump
VDRAKPNLPAEAEEPVVVEINTSLFPIGSVVLSGDAPERTLNAAASQLQDAFESIPGVLEVEIKGQRDDVVDVIIKPGVLETYNLRLEEILSLISANNQLIAVGRAQNAQGDLVLSLPGLIDSLETLRSLPIKITPERVIRVQDVAQIRPTFVEQDSLSALNGKNALTLDIKKKVGANVIETMTQVENVLEQAQEQLPSGLSTQIVLNESNTVKDMLGSLESNVIASVLLVMIVILWGMGPRNALLVGLGVPGAFLVGVLAIQAMGYTMNMVVLFALILVVGLLVDGTIVTVEYADTLRKQGVPGRQAFPKAAQRMAGPIISSSATTISVFFPLLFWDQTVGDFMKYLPITVIVTLTASVAMALIFVPVAGSILLKDTKIPDVEDIDSYGENIVQDNTFYTKILSFMFKHPLLVSATAIALMISGFQMFAAYGNGVIFFPETEPDAIMIAVDTEDPKSFEERREVMMAIDAEIADIEGIKYRSLEVAAPNSEGSLGQLRLTLDDWWARPTADILTTQLREEISERPGVGLTITRQQGGPGASKPFSVTLFHQSGTGLEDVEHVLALMNTLGGFEDVEDNRPKPGVEWSVQVDRLKAAEFGLDMTLIGQSARLFAQGVTVTTYRPEGSDESIDIRVRVPKDQRTLDELAAFRIPTANGFIPLSSVADIAPERATGFIRLEDGQRVHTITANLAPGITLGTQVSALEELLDKNPPPNSTWNFGGDAEEQADAMAFLSLAFGIAVGLMFFILLIQFNSFAQTLLVMSAILLSIGGVFWFLALTVMSFIVVMGGIGIIALAGLVINTNILLIDTWNILRKAGHSAQEAAMMAASNRLRPILLTTITTILGLMPMSLGLSLDIIGGSWEVGAPATQWWVELATTITGGLLFATLITLFLTPTLLAQSWAIPKRKKKKK